ncbi:hypothetical protein HBH25_21940 [Pseudomonas sp. hsmgli-8]|uniref:Uncharacterized protein n=1 Tax=Pseudomonas quercus TaxID=2722792 RepID=A0ABX0YMW6_9PSED|nr:hypothetical protein [Pseudomonas quercus]
MNNEVVLKNGFFQVRKLRITRQLDCQVFIVLALVTNAGFTVGRSQGIKVSTGSHILFNNLLDQGLLELTVLAVEIIAFVPGQYAGRIADIYTDTLPG